MKMYNHKEIEEKWKTYWEKNKTYSLNEDSLKPKCYVLDMFPYPSGSSMHVGHPRGYVGTDVYSRFKRMQGFNVLHPMGWDAFGLPAEETAIKEKVHPTIVVERNINRFKEQLKLIGPDYDWSREISTADPEFYKQTQRLFLEFFKVGLAYNKEVTVNWCEGLGTVLANEDIVDGKSERGDFPVIQKPMRQWVLGITEYADRLVDDLEQLKQWPEYIKNAQKNWIGRSIGHEVEFEIENQSHSLKVFTTRIDTLFGVSYIGVSPEHEILNQMKDKIKNLSEVKEYVELSKLKTDLDKKKSTEKTGVKIEGLYCINPINSERVDIWVSDYVSSSYGTGAIMGVPAHDERDYEFACKFHIPSIKVIDEKDRLINSNGFSGLSIEEGALKISEKVNSEKVKKFKIRDWVFSRQRFWGEPFPIVWISDIEAYNMALKSPMKEWLPKSKVSYIDKDDKEWFALPVMPQYLDSVQLPEVESYEQKGTGEGPLSRIPEWVNTAINVETGEVSNYLNIDNKTVFYAKRETNTMPQWAGSSWYYLRFLDNKNLNSPFNKDKEREWCPINVYSGADHATAHLIYARFWHKVLYDANLVANSEPFPRLEFLGYILDTDGSKFSKRKNTAIKPDDVIDEFGADAFRLYEMFIGPFEKPVKWNKNGPLGTKRFLQKVWRLQSQISTSENIEVKKILHQTIKEVSEDIEVFKFNTAIPRLMKFVTIAERNGISKKQYLEFLQILAPFAPFLTEELWTEFGQLNSIHLSNWPQYDDALIEKNTFELIFQINGKKKGSFLADLGISESEVMEKINNDKNLAAKLKDVKVKKVIFVQDRLINFVCS
ncbi:leucine--tRNA ligase [Microcoleus sp. PH2017_28_MFU_U_A]|uniref:leucine--tRNA ligase n=1 Tax=Microcoleus sp. PH2017_28_MFU_U_A TaxID=2798838 RepID=UPI001D53E386|nr:leucine--tRNA ligase [Microcoleus sp. PH2017_28_MFU_U_A]MCC3589216.1 leucine--tRNA ligase [Microcoleus sp. PH2017_28_MFU_U_A]